MKRKIGLVIAVEQEPFERVYGKPKTKTTLRGFEVSCYERPTYDLYAVSSGVGEVMGAASTQFLIDHYGVDLILNYGVVGALEPNAASSSLCLISSVVDYAFDVSEIDGVEVGRHSEEAGIAIPTDPHLRSLAKEAYPDLPELVLASGDRFVGKAKDKAYLHEHFGASLCDMESAGILRTAKRNDVPSLFVKSVADTLFGGAGEYTEKRDAAAAECAGILDHLMEVLGQK